jgi:hypothetical protein
VAKVWREVPEVGDKIEAYVTYPPVRIVRVRPYTGRYTKYFTHFIKYVSPMAMSGFVEACWPMAGACWVVGD